MIKLNSKIKKIIKRGHTKISPTEKNEPHLSPTYAPQKTELYIDIKRTYIDRM